MNTKHEFGSGLAVEKLHNGNVELSVNDEFIIDLDDVLSLVAFLAREGIIRGWVGRMLRLLLKAQS